MGIRLAVASFFSNTHFSSCAGRDCVNSVFVIVFDFYSRLERRIRGIVHLYFMNVEQFVVRSATKREQVLEYSSFIVYNSFMNTHHLILNARYASFADI